MKKVILMLSILASSLMANAQDKESSKEKLVRISEIKIYPQYLQEYLQYALTIGATSVKEEPGVICIYPMQQKRDSCQIRILEIYADNDAYKHHIASEHFQKYKKRTLNMVKSLDEDDMKNIFTKIEDGYTTIFKTEKRASNDYNTGTVHMSVHKNTGNTMITSFLFEAGSRNFWHYHPEAEQTLMVLKGEGYYQEEGKEKRIIRKGDIIITPANILHWNGATKNSSIECITVTEHTVNNHAVQVRDVSDDEYNK